MNTTKSNKTIIILCFILILIFLVPVVYQAGYDIGRNAAKRDIIRHQNDIIEIE